MACLATLIRIRICNTKRVQRRLDRREDGDDLVEANDVNESLDDARWSSQYESLPPLKEKVARVQQRRDSGGVDALDRTQVDYNILIIFQERFEVTPKDGNACRVYLSSWTKQNHASGVLSIHYERYSMRLWRSRGHREHLLPGKESPSIGRSMPASRTRDTNRRLVPSLLCLAPIARQGNQVEKVFWGTRNRSMNGLLFSLATNPLAKIPSQKRGCPESLPLRAPHRSGPFDLRPLSEKHAHDLPAVPLQPRRISSA